jgi:hypothetical protein
MKKFQLLKYQLLKWRLQITLPYKHLHQSNPLNSNATTLHQCVTTAATKLSALVPATYAQAVAQQLAVAKNSKQFGSIFLLVVFSKL